jgi:hypothetical protein
MGGKAILFPGGSFTGKTTVVSELVRGGATYYSDEFAVIDSRGFVHPYSRPFIAARSDKSTESIGAPTYKKPTDGRTPVPVGLVILSRYKSGAHWRPRPISPGRALLGILDCTVCAERSPETTLKILKEVVSHGFMLKGLRGEAKEVAEWISGNFQPDQVFRSLNS